MMVLYSGTTCPFSHRCRFVLFEKGMDFEIRDVDLFTKPEDIALMNPYDQVPILVERDLILYESHIINEYIDERFPHPQLMPGDPVARARVRLFLLNFEKELFAHVNMLESRGVKANDKQLEKARAQIRDRLTQLAPIFLKNKYMLGDDFSMLDVAIAPLLWRLDYYGIDMSQERGAAAEVRRAHLLAPGLHRGADAVRKGDAQVGRRARRHDSTPPIAPADSGTSTRPYLIRALHDWCTDNGFTPYVAVLVDATRAGAARVREEQRDRAQRRLRGHQRAEARQRVHRVQGALRRHVARDRRAGRPRDRHLCARERAGHGVSGAQRSRRARHAERPMRRPSQSPAPARRRGCRCTEAERAPTRAAAERLERAAASRPAAGGAPVAQARQVAPDHAPYRLKSVRACRLSSVGRATAL